METQCDARGFFVGSSVIETESIITTEDSDVFDGVGAPRPNPQSSPTDSDDFSNDETTQSVCNVRAHFLADLTNYVALGAVRLNVALDPTSGAVRKLMIGVQNEEEEYPNPVISKMIDKGWVLVKQIDHVADSNHAVLQLFAIPEDVGRRFRRGMLEDFRRGIKFLLRFIDLSPSAWDAAYDPDTSPKSYAEPGANNESLFYIFNTLSSPKPEPPYKRDHSSLAIFDVLEDAIDGLKTKLYPYQKRSVAIMLQREINPAKSVDPRKSLYDDFLGRQFYLDVQDGILIRYPHVYEDPQGGILAETMGYGKTLICLAAILATRGHYPRIPGGRIDSTVQPRPRVASLLQMSAASVGRNALPWKAEFHALKKAGYHYDKCVEELKRHVRDYNEPIFNPLTPSRAGKRQFQKNVKLCSATLIIVPPNLLVQWQQEISRHVQKDALDVLVLDHTTKKIPECKELLKYDVILLTKARFEQEYRDDDLHNGKCGRGAETLQSSLTDVRWLRVICDEGHGFAGSASRTKALAMLDKMYIERRWVVSGTPSASLLGVEVGLAAETKSDSSLRGDIANALQMRRSSDASGNETKDMERLKYLVVNFLQVQPWANNKGVDVANWKKYLAPFDANGQRRKAGCLRTLLQSLIVRHRIEDIDADLCLPLLHNRRVLLEPSYYDKLSMNLFTFFLTSNAITSERTDEDYMFHPKNRKQLELLINNLRQSSFHWVGFRPEDVTETLRVSDKYLDEHIDSISDHDGFRLTEGTMNGRRALEDRGWSSFSTLHEIGVYVQNFPSHAAETWSIDGQSQNPLLLGITQASSCQKFVAAHLHEEDPTAGLSGAGIRAMQAAREKAADELGQRGKGNSKMEEPKLKNQTSSSLASDSHKGFQKRKIVEQSTGINPLSPLAKSAIVGFSSAKLTYLVDQVLIYHQAEKIIIFYDANNVAFWIAEALELLSVKFLIYANTLTTARRATYLQTFNESDEFRVLLMDLKQAAHGLHVACASRVYIVNPIWQPNIESQAIKRAHRIGQTRPVFVETLVLSGSLEQKMLSRRSQMSTLELEHAEKSLLDDGTMNQIVRDPRFLKFGLGERNSLANISRLSTPRPLFGQVGGTKISVDPEAGLIKTTVVLGGTRGLTVNGGSPSESTRLGPGNPPPLKKPKKSVRMVAPTDIIP